MHYEICCYSNQVSCFVEPCDEGEYSVTGYAPCKKCPINFYQDQTGQEMCKPCGNSSITERSGSNHSSFCIQLGKRSFLLYK